MKNAANCVENDLDPAIPRAIQYPPARTSVTNYWIVYRIEGAVAVSKALLCMGC